MRQSPVINQSQLKKLLNSTKMTKHRGRNRLIVCLSYYAGLRACEIAGLCVNNVCDVDGNIKETVILKSNQTKGHKTQSVYLSDALRGEIKEYISQNPKLLKTFTAPLIQFQKGGGFSSQTIQNLFKILYKSVGLDDCSSHGGRRFFITHLSELGVSVRVIQELARHSSLATTQRYIDVSPVKLKNAVNLVSL